MDSEPRRLLLIHEDVDWLRSARVALGCAAYGVEVAGAWSSAYDLVQSQPFGLILVDMKSAMQDMDSFGRVARLQAAGNGRTVVLCGTELTPDAVAPFFSMGAHDCLDKPYDLGQLVDLVKQQLHMTAIPRVPDKGDPATQPQRPARILIVEDEADWRRRLAGYLQVEPDAYSVETAGDPRTAAQNLAEKQFDVVVLDLRLFEYSEDFEGMQLLKLLREKERSVAVVVVSAYGTVTHVKDGFQLYSICAYLSKQSFSPAEFRTQVKRAALERGKEA
ncbi:MAG: response regulator [Anaerolineae bacterium]|nr:response regulator [Anaerolineae bacterium]